CSSATADSRSRCTHATERSRRRSGTPGDLLHLGVLLHAEPPALAAETRLLEPAEGGVQKVEAVVDPHHAGADALGERERTRRAARVDRAAEAVRRVCGDADRLVGIRVRDHRHHRPEDLLLRDPDAVRDGAEDRRLEEVAALQVLRAATAVGERGTLLLPGGDVLLDLRPALLADDRA